MSEAQKLQGRVAEAFDETAGAGVRDGASLPTTFAINDSLHNALGDILVCRDQSGRILAANAVFRQFAGPTAPEGKTCAELGFLFRPTNVANRFDVTFATSSGERIFIWHDIVVQDPGLAEPVVQSIARDVTAERRDTLAKDKARLRAEEESSLKSRLIATVSHEIRTPLSGLLGMGHLLARTKLTPEQKNYLDGISQSGTALVQLVEDLLDYSTMEAGRFRLRSRPEPIRPLIEGVVELLSSRAHAKGIELGSVVAADLPEQLEFDPARFRQVLYNVIGNAVKFTDEGGVLVSAKLEADQLVVRVSDTGPGMTDIDRQRIFGEFEQAEQGLTRDSGVGLGLAISARIMAEAGGSMEVESHLGAGSTFIVRLPVRAPAPAQRRGNELASSRVLLLAPAGPAASALAGMLDALGAATVFASNMDVARNEIASQPLFTDIIIDHRLDESFVASLGHNERIAGSRRIFLVNPESRPARMSGTNYDSWLIRPLREQSLIDVLTGKLKGLERRFAASEAFPHIDASPGEDIAEAGPDERPVYRIALCEDDAVNALVVRATLENNGHSVRIAPDLAALGATIEESRPDLIITDNSLPDGASGGFIAALRARETATASPHLPVIVLTASDESGLHEALRAAGADDVVAKPFAPDKFTTVIERAMRRRCETDR